MTYDHDDNEDSMQVLGPADEEQVTKLRDLTLVEKSHNELETMDIDASVPPHKGEAREVAMEHLRTEKTSERIGTDLERGHYVHRTH